MCFQPPNTPSFNVVDLGFFNFIQALNYIEAPSNIDELVSAVERPYEALTPQTLDHVFVTLQLCMVEAMKMKGSNNYKIPHIGKNQHGYEEATLKVL